MKITEKQLRNIIRESIEEISMGAIEKTLEDGPKWGDYKSALEDIISDIEEDSYRTEGGFDSNPNVQKLLSGLNELIRLCSKKDEQFDRVNGESSRLQGKTRGDLGYWRNYGKDLGNGYDWDKFNDAQYGDLYRKYN